MKSEARNLKLKLRDALICSAALAMGLTIAGCGSREKDPFKNYETLKNSVPYHAQDNLPRSTITQLFSIDNQDSLNFNQGEERVVNFKVNLFFDVSDTVVYNLAIDRDNSTISRDATLTRLAGSDIFALKWRPSISTLTSTESHKTMDLVLKFELLNGSSPSALAKMPKGYYSEKKYSVELYKELDQPVIEDSTATPIKLIPGQEVNADQDVTIQFVAAAKGLHKPQDLKINFNRGPAEPSLELAQLDGYSATDLTAAQNPASLGVDSSGRTRYLYTVKFHAREFADQLNRFIDKTPALAAKFSKGILTAGEAVFYISAYNEYSQRFSSQREITIKVNMSDKAGEAKIISEPAALTALVGQSTSAVVLIRSESARGSLKITAARFNEKDQPSELVKNAVTLTQDTASVTLACSTPKNSMGDAMGCKSGSCLKSCTVQVASSCDAKEGTMNLIISTESAVGSSIVQKDLTYTISLKGKNTSCNKQQTDPTQQTEAKPKSKHAEKKP